MTTIILNHKVSERIDEIDESNLTDSQKRQLKVIKGVRDVMAQDPEYQMKRAVKMADKILTDAYSYTETEIDNTYASLRAMGPVFNAPNKLKIDILAADKVKVEFEFGPSEHYAPKEPLVFEVMKERWVSDKTAWKTNGRLYDQSLAECIYAEMDRWK